MHHLVRSVLPGTVQRLLPKVPKRVVVVGGGPVGLFCADRLRHHFELVTVVDPKEYFEFTPGVLRALAEAPHLSRITFDYREVLERQMGVEFVLGEACGIVGGSGAGMGAVTVAPQSGGPEQLPFDYCVVAVGMGNGVWKPRYPGATGVSAEKHLPDERTLAGRRAALREFRGRLASAKRVHVIGAGLVGSELAAEIAHFMPRVDVQLYDGMPHVLPQLPVGARNYAQEWLHKNGVQLRLGEKFDPKAVDSADPVVWCMGTEPRASRLFENAGVLDTRGYIPVNRRMQVQQRVEAGAASDEGAEATPGNSATPGRVSTTSTMGGGRIFAAGDAVSVEGVPLTQTIFHGEEMAAIAVSNIEAVEGIASPLAGAGGGVTSSNGREAEPNVPLLCCGSLGPTDGLFSTQSELISTGTLAALQKGIIEETKMAALRGDVLSFLAWWPVH